MKKDLKTNDLIEYSNYTLDLNLLDRDELIERIYLILNQTDKLIQEAYNEGKRHGYDDGYSESRGEGNYNPDGF